MTSPLVSVVTPSYNCAGFIEATILSVKNQTYPDIEHIIMDGGSTDSTPEILRKYEGTYNMRWVSEPDRGQSDAINKGFRSARGEILSWLNSDDVYLPGAAATAVNFFRAHPDAGMVYGECHIIDECGAVTGRCESREFALQEMLCHSNVVPQPAAFWRRAAWEAAGELDTDLHFVMDFDLWLRIALKFPIAHTPEYLASFRLCRGTKTSDLWDHFAREEFRMLDKLFATPDLPAEVARLKRCAYSRVHYKAGTSYHAHRQMKAARQHLLKAARLNPRILLDPYMVGYLLTAFLRK